MNKTKLIVILMKTPINSLLNLNWDRGNGKIHRIVQWKGFVDTNPQLFLNEGTYLDLGKIGYKSVTSIDTPYGKFS